MASGTVVYHNYSEYIQSTISVWFLGYRGPWACIRFLHVMWCDVMCRQRVYRLSAVYIETLWILWVDIVYSDAVRPRHGRQNVLSSCWHRWTPSSGDYACWRMFSDQSRTCRNGPTDSVTPVNVHRYDKICEHFECVRRLTKSYSPTHDANSSNLERTEDIHLLL